MDVKYGRGRAFASDQDGQTSAARLPARAQRLLEASYTLCADGLQELLHRSLAEFEKQLFELADHARNSTVQQDCFASRQRVLQDGGAFAKRFMEQLGSAFDQIGQPNGASDRAAGDSLLWQSLELVDPGEQEILMLIEQLAARGEVRNSYALCELGYRLGVLAGAPPLEGKALPIGPHVMAKACNAACSELELPLDHQLLLLQQFDQCGIQSFGPLYDAINAQLRAAGIMPQLRSGPIPRHSGKRSRPADINSDDVGDPATAAPAVAEAAATHLPGSTPGAPIEVLESLRNLLAQQRTAQGGRSGRSAGRTASEDELQSALGALQQHLAQVTDQASRELHSAVRLREELIAQLNFGKPDSAPRTRLSDEQGDTVELVAQLFEQLGHQLQQGSNATTMLTDLQLPVLRMAVADPGFFEQHEHPARRLLDTVTAVANDWLDGSDDASNRPLATKLEQLISRANREPPSAGLYTTLLADIEHHLALLTRKAQASERRHVEAAQGRERLDQARHRAGELMAERFAQSPPRGLLRALLDRAWSDVLALTLLRHGENSDTFRTQLKITDQLLGRVPIDDRLNLQMEVESGLQQIGMHAEEAEQVAQRLLGTGELAPSVELPSTTDLAVRLKQHRRLGEQQPNHEVAASAPSAVQTKATATVTPAQHKHAVVSQSRAPQAEITLPVAKGAVPKREAAILDPRIKRIEERLRELPFGSWFEFSDPTTGQVSRRKLAWYSPMSGRCLLVNRRGQRGEEMTLAQLANEMASDRAREAPARPDSLLDRAWRGLTGSLQARHLTPAEATDA